MKRKFVSIERLKMLTDGLLAIVMTILVLEIKVPILPGVVSNKTLLLSLYPLIPQFIAYIISFLLIAKYWQLHHFLFLDVKSTDASLLWLNLFFLLTISFLPFPTQLLSEYHLLTAVIVIFNLSVVLPAIMLALMAIYIAKIKEIRLEALEHSDIKHLRTFLQRLLGVPLIAILSIAISFFNPSYAMATWMLMVFIILDVFWRKQNK